MNISTDCCNCLKIGTYERKDAEVFYLSFIVQSLPDADDTTRTKEHPRWAELCRGMVDSTSSSLEQVKLTVFS